MQYPKGVQYREKMILKFEYKYKKIRYENNFVLSSLTTKGVIKNGICSTFFRFPSQSMIRIWQG